jgi:hypothetical protein
MILRYHPEGDETPQEWTLDLGRLRSKEIEAIEKRTKMHYGSAFKQALLEGNGLARRAILWTFLRRTHHTLLFDDVDFADAEVTIEMETDELHEAIEQLRSSDIIPEEQRTIALAALQADLDARTTADPDAAPVDEPGDEPAGEGEAAAAAGKARTRTSRSASS